MEATDEDQARREAEWILNGSIQPNFDQNVAIESARWQAVSACPDQVKKHLVIAQGAGFYGSALVCVETSTAKLEKLVRQLTDN